MKKSDFHPSIDSTFICFTIETTPSLSPKTYKILNTLNVFVAIFTLEYVVRIYFKQKTKFIFSFFGLIDLIVFILLFILRVRP